MVLALLTNPAFTSIIVAVITVIGMKLMEHFLLGKKLRLDDATAIRQELRAEVLALRKELDEWRNKYYALKEENNKIILENERNKQKMEELLQDVEEMRKQLASMDKKQTK